MKKVLLVLLLAAVLTTGTAFADDPRPDGFGIGVFGGWGGGWQGGSGSANFGLALHAANIYWGVNLAIRDHWFNIAVSGDFLTLLGGNIAGPFGWYIDVGLYGGIGIWSPPAPIDGGILLDFGARLPIGLNVNLQVIDLWLAFIPRIGLGIGLYEGGGLGLGGGWGPEFGIRVWF